MLTTTTALKIRCDRDDLLAAIQAADTVVPTNSAKPILTNLQLDATNDRLEIIATDMQVGLRSIIKKVEIDRTGQAVVLARQLAGILKESRSNTVTMELDHRDDQSQLKISLSDGDYQIPAVVGESFPAVSFFPTDVPAIPIKAARLEEMIRQTNFAVDRDRTSAVLSGLNLTVGDGEFVLAATDGKVLCEAVEKHADYKLSEPVQAIVPAATINHLHRILTATKPETVQVAFASKLIFIRISLSSASALQVELTSRLVEGNFPPYRNALPGKSPSSVTFDTADLASAVRRTALMTSNTSRGIVLNLDRDQALLSNLNYTNGSARIPITCAYQGPAVKLGINAQYLGEVLKVYQAPKIEIEMSKGLIMREPGVTFLIMPIGLPS